MTTYSNLNALLNLYDDEGKLQLDKDREAARAYFLEEVNVNTRFFHDLEEKIEYLTENDYWDPDTLNQYDPAFVKRTFKRAYDYKYRFASFMGALKFYTSYALRSNDGKTILERYEDRMVMVALHLAQGDERFATELLDELMTNRYTPATPTLQNAGKARGGFLVSCFLLDTQDSLDSIKDTWNYAAQLSKIGGGVAINMTDIREQGAPLKGKDGLAKGIVPWMKIYEDIFSTVDQLGTRQGAGAVYLNVHHPDILRFLDTKRENADEKVRIKTLSIGVVVTDIMMELARKGEDMYLFSPHSVFKEYGEKLSQMDISARYHELVDNPNIVKTKLNPRRLLSTIAELQFEAGYPYIVFEDTVNRENPIDGRVSFSNLCVTGDTELLTDRGYRKARDLYETQEDFKVVVDLRARDMDLSKTGTSVENSTKMFKTAENAETYTLTTNEGHSITATAWHKFYVVRDGELVKIPLAEVKVGDESLTEQGIATVTSIESAGTEDVYDVTVENGHSVIFNGIVTGNCSEILQTSTPSQYDEESGAMTTVGKDISCNLGSMNVYNAMLSPNFAKTVEVSMRALTAVSDMTDVKRVPTVQKANAEMHSVGLGQMSLATYFGTHQMHYGEEESLDFTNIYFMTVNYWSLVASNKIAVERGASFSGFEKSAYADGSYFDQYVEGDEVAPKTERVRQLLEEAGTPVPTQEDWKKLKKKVMKSGLWHSYRIAIPPTGSISYCSNSSASIHPILSKIEIRKEGRIGRVYYPTPHLSEENAEFFEDAYQIGWKKLIDVYAAATPHVDQGLSLTMFFHENATTRDLNRAQIYAWNKGIKTMYYIRLRSVQLAGTEVEGCVSCAV